jgi:N-acyl-D-amino-acid deacylase
MAEYDLVIRGGTIVDGTRIPRYVADLAIKDGRIATIGKVAAHEGRRSIDADGLVVAPGVIDLHTHYDAQLF